MAYDLTGISVLSYALMNSLAEFAESNQFADGETSKMEIVNKHGDVFLPFNKNVFFDFSDDDIAKQDDMLPTFMKDPTRSMDLIDVGNFRSNYLKREVTTLHYDESVFLPTLLKDLAELDSTYGVIIQVADKNYIFNPLHPVNAFLVALGLHELPKKGELHIFEWTDAIKNQINGFEENATQKYIKDYQILFEKIPQLLMLEKYESFTQNVNIPEARATNLITEPFVEDIQSIISISRQSEDRSRIKSILVPTQVAVDNMVTPYYGLLKINSPTLSTLFGKVFTPMISGNIQVGNGFSLQAMNENANIENVCTGSENAILPSGWFTLSRINVNSMYFDNIVDRNEVLPFVAASKKISSELWETIEKTKLEQLEEVA